MVSVCTRGKWSLASFLATGAHGPLLAKNAWLVDTWPRDISLIQHDGKTFIVSCLELRLMSCMQTAYIFFEWLKLFIILYYIMSRTFCSWKDKAKCLQLVSTPTDFYHWNSSLNQMNFSVCINNVSIMNRCNSVNNTQQPIMTELIFSTFSFFSLPIPLSRFFVFT